MSGKIRFVMHKRGLWVLLVVGLASSGCIFEDDECPEDQEPYSQTGDEGPAMGMLPHYHHGEEEKTDCPQDPQDSEPY